jgi:hypothetical protein
MESAVFLFYIAEQGRPLTKAKEKAKKECLPKKNHFAGTPYSFPYNQRIKSCQ